MNQINPMGTRTAKINPMDISLILPDLLPTLFTFTAYAPDKQSNATPKGHQPDYWIIALQKNGTSATKQSEQCSKNNQEDVHYPALAFDLFIRSCAAVSR